MEYDIKGKRTIITGGAGGIGYAIADKYLQVGAELAILIDIDETNGTKSAERLNKTYGAGKAAYIKCDVTKDLEIVFELILKTYKKIDVLVNSAAIADEDVPRRIIDINATSVAEWSLKFYEHMRSDKGGSGGIILSISSILGYRVVPFSSLYQMTKFAVHGFTRSLGHKENFNKTGVRIVALCPGFTCTKITANLIDALEGDDKKRELISEHLIRFAQNLPRQEADAVGDAAIEVFQRAKSGTVWLIEGGKPIEEILHLA